MFRLHKKDIQDRIKLVFSNTKYTTFQIIQSSNVGHYLSFQQVKLLDTIDWHNLDDSPNIKSPPVVENAIIRVLRITWKTYLSRPEVNAFPHTFITIF